MNTRLIKELREKVARLSCAGESLLWEAGKYPDTGVAKSGGSTPLSGDF